MSIRIAAMGDDNLVRVLLTAPSSKAPQWSILNKNVSLRSNLGAWIDELALVPSSWDARYMAMKRQKFRAEVEGSSLDESFLG